MFSLLLGLSFRRGLACGKIVRSAERGPPVVDWILGLEVLVMTFREVERRLFPSDVLNDPLSVLPSELRPPRGSVVVGL